MSKMKRGLAIFAIILLAGLYVATLVLALLNNEAYAGLLKVSFLMTFAIPVILYIYTLMIKKAKERKENRETGIIDESLLDSTEENDD